MTGKTISSENIMLRLWRLSRHSIMIMRSGETKGLRTAGSYLVGPAADED
jgi:hypothetical protein